MCVYVTKIESYNGVKWMYTNGHFDEFPQGNFNGRKFSKIELIHIW